MKGILFIANGRVLTRSQEDSYEPIKTSSFLAPCIWAANSLGLRLYQGVNRTYASQLKSTEYDITFYNQHIYRNIFNLKDLWIGYKNLCLFLESNPGIDIIHCNTPIGGVLGRICGYKYHKKIIYMAHGFHFYKGAPFLNKTLFKYIEMRLARKTDCIITINQEDYAAAQMMSLNKNGKVYKINGVGVDLESFAKISIDCVEKRRELGIPQDVVVGIVVGDLNENKNVETIIRALAIANKHIHLVICGIGPLEYYLKKMAQKLNVENRCHFLGFRSDVKELYMISDMFVFASQREGLPRSTMEAMLAGLPCIVSKIRGNVDLILEGCGGFLFDPKDYKNLAIAMNQMSTDSHVRKRFGKFNRERITLFDIEIVKQQMLDIYKEVL